MDLGVIELLPPLLEELVLAVLEEVPEPHGGGIQLQCCC